LNERRAGENDRARFIRGGGIIGAIINAIIDAVILLFVIGLIKR
jgi:hypothetical protein